MASNYSLRFTTKTGDVKGDSANPGHAGEIEILSWSMVVSARGVVGQSGPQDKQMTAMRITKHQDSASARLFNLCVAGEISPQAVLTCARNIGQGRITDYSAFTMEQVMVDSASTTGSGVNGDVLDIFSLSFTKMTVSYAPDDASGKLGARTTATLSNVA